MPTPVPNNLALAVINTGDVAQSAPLRNNYAAIQAAVNALIACLDGGVAGQVLQAVDGTDVQWGKPPGTIMAAGIGQVVSTAGTTFAGGQNLLAANLSFTADGVSRYAVQVAGQNWSNNFAGATTVIASSVVDAAQGGTFNATAFQASLTPFAGAIDLGILVAGAHTINVRIFGGTGTTAVPAGSVVTVVKVT